MAASAPNFNYGFPTPGPQSPSADNVMDHVFFLSNEMWKRAREEEKFDYIIVGSGFCGYAFAQRIYEHDRKAKILMLERGTFFLPIHFQNLSPVYFKVLGGLSETFPWTITRESLKKHNVFQHGMIPFVGGRSIQWSAWCPEPRKSELDFFPESVAAAMHSTYFDSARKTLNVMDVNQIEQRIRSEVGGRRPVYGKLHNAVHKKVSKIWGSDDHHRTLHAPLAVASPTDETFNFYKFSVPEHLLNLITHTQTTEGSSLKVATNCTVEKILHADNGNGEVTATALKTSRGVVSIRDAKVILASGALPPATLVQNSFPQQCPQAGRRFSAHVITSITARIKAELVTQDKLEQLEIGAIYVDRQHANGLHYHVQMSVFCVDELEKNINRALRYTPDVIASASKEQLETSPGYVIFVCAVLGELDHGDASTPGTASSFLKNPHDSNITTNSVLNVIINEKTKEMWAAMDTDTIHLLDNIAGQENVEYWIPDGPFKSEGPRPLSGEWRKSQPPPPEKRRSPDLVHEGSTLHMGSADDAPVGVDYRLKGVENVFVTGAALWPKAGSWNPTMMMVGMAQHLADNFYGGRLPHEHKAGEAKGKEEQETTPQEIGVFLHTAINTAVVSLPVTSKFSEAFTRLM